MKHVINTIPYDPIRGDGINHWITVFKTRSKSVCVLSAASSFVHSAIPLWSTRGRFGWSLRDRIQRRHFRRKSSLGDLLTWSDDFCAYIYQLELVDILVFHNEKNLQAVQNSAIPNFDIYILTIGYSTKWRQYYRDKIRQNRTKILYLH